jgi:iron complex outermembrane recepter protein
MRIGSRIALFPLGALGTLSCNPALAQTSVIPGGQLASDTASSADDGGKTGGEIVVTGSRIARRDLVSESPIVTVGQDLIAKSGSSTIETSLNQLPQFTASSTGSSNLNSRGGQANADLRGLGVQRTLVLMDGRRMQPSNSDGSVDLNTVPDALLENVEVITGGASAVYGSDAIAGVLNFKIKDHFNGAQVSAQYGLADRGDGASTNISAAFGGNFADDKGNAILGLSYSDRNSVFGADRPFFRVSNISANLPEGVIKPSATNLPTQAATNAVFAKYGIGAGTVSNKNTFGFNNDGTLYSAGSPALHLTDSLGDLVTKFNNTYYYNTGLIYYLQLPLTRYSIFSKL